MLVLFCSSVLLKETHFIPADEVIFYVFTAVGVASQYAPYFVFGRCSLTRFRHRRHTGIHRGLLCLHSRPQLVGGVKQWYLVPYWVRMSSRGLPFRSVSNTYIVLSLSTNRLYVDCCGGLLGLLRTSEGMLFYSWTSIGCHFGRFFFVSPHVFVTSPFGRAYYGERYWSSETGYPPVVIDHRAINLLKGMRVLRELASVKSGLELPLIAWFMRSRGEHMVVENLVVLVLDDMHSVSNLSKVCLRVTGVIGAGTCFTTRGTSWTH